MSVQALHEIASARERVMQRIAKLERELATLRAELADLNAAERVLQKLAVTGESAGAVRSDVAQRKFRVRDHIYNALVSFGSEWVSTQDLKRRVEEMISAPVKDSTLSGTLHRFRHANLAEQNGRSWRAIALPSPLIKAPSETETAPHHQSPKRGFIVKQ